MAEFSLNLDEKIGIAPEVRSCLKMIEGKLVETEPKTVRATVKKIENPSEVTSEEIATKLNEMIDVLFS